MDPASLDIALLEWLHRHPVAHSVPVLQAISETTTYVSAGFAVTVMILALFRRSRILWMKFAALVIVLLLVAGVSQGLKALIDRDRPFETLPHIEKLSTGGGSSFPSGHTLEAFAMAVSLSVLFPRRRILFPVFTWALLVACSRVTLGVHYPSDVLAGIFLGSLLGWGVCRVFRVKFRHNLKSGDRGTTDMQ